MVITKVEVGLLILWVQAYYKGDLSDPPVSAVFSGEVPLSRRGSYTGLDATMIAGTGAGGSQKAKSVVSACERSQLRQIRSNDVPSGSQQTDRQQDVFLQFFSRKVIIRLRIPPDLLPQYDGSNLADETDKVLEILLGQSLCPGSIQN